MAADAPLDRPLSLKEVARHLSVTPRTVERYIEMGRFPPAGYTAGGAKCWFLEDIQAYRHYMQRGTWKPIEGVTPPVLEDEP